MPGHRGFAKLTSLRDVCASFLAFGTAPLKQKSFEWATTPIAAHLASPRDHWPFDKAIGCDGSSQGGHDVQRERSPSAKRTIHKGRFQEELLPQVETEGNGAQPDKHAVSKPDISKSLFHNQSGRDGESDQKVR